VFKCSNYQDYYSENANRTDWVCSAHRQEAFEYKTIKQRITNMVGTIRQKVREVLRDADTRLLIKHGVLSDNENITDVGRRMMDDLLFNGVEVKDLKKEITKLVKLVDAEENKNCKK
jgi:hypothetical protein